jgi:hypothetical protein
MKRIILMTVLMTSLLSCSNSVVGRYDLISEINHDTDYDISNYDYNYVELKADGTFLWKESSSGNESERVSGVWSIDGVILTVVEPGKLFPFHFSLVDGVLIIKIPLRNSEYTFSKKGRVKEKSKDKPEDEVVNENVQEEEYESDVQFDYDESEEQLTSKNEVSPFAIVEITEHGFKKIQELKPTYNTQDVYYYCKGVIRNQSDKKLTRVNVYSFVEIKFDNKTIGLNASRDDARSIFAYNHNGNDVECPWNSNEDRIFEFVLSSSASIFDVDYFEYVPISCSLEFDIRVNDLVGYEYADCVEKFDIISDWKAFQEKLNSEKQ